MELAYLFIFAVWIGSEIWISLREYGQTRNEQDRHTKKVFAACVVAALCIGWFGPRPSRYNIFWKYDLMQMIGAALMLTGVVVRASAVLTLGRYFRTTVMVQKGQKVIMAGPYAYIRHPSYTGTLLTVTGLGIYLNNWFTLAVMFIIMFFGVSRRIKVEEDVMSRELGKVYLTYMKRTKKLVPFIY